MTTIHGILERNARKFPNKEAFISKTARLTYPDMNRIANQLARFLKEKGIKQKDHIAIQSRNNEHFFYAYFALLKLGAIPIPLNVRLTSNEIDPILKNMDAVGILFESDFESVVDEVNGKNSMPYICSIEGTIKQAQAFSGDNLNLSIDSGDICQILLTSGTTGLPKGVQFSHDQVTAVAMAIAAEFHISHNDRALTLMPLSHSAPLNCFFMSPFICGASHILGDFTPQSFLHWIQQEQTTFTFAAPVAYVLAAKAPNLKDFDLSSMRVFAYGGGAMTLASYQYVTHAFQNTNFYQVYGLTEAGPNGSLLRPEEHLSKSGSIGKTPVMNMEMKVVTNEGIETAPGEYGEIVLAGDSVMAGYYNNPQATDEMIRDGWIYTGDIAYRDEDDFLFIVDRKKDIIITGGVNVYPREIEELLSKYPGVQQACVVGIQDPIWGETIKAVITREEHSQVTEDDLTEYLSEHLADYKCPRIYSFVNELPYNANGKVLKQLVKEM